MSSFWCPRFWFLLTLFLSFGFVGALAQDSSTGVIRGTVSDTTGGRIGGATVALINTATNFRYATTTDITGRFAFELLPPGFNLLNRDNQRVQITQDGFISNSAQFVHTSKVIGINIFPAQYRTPTSFLRATDAYSPRQVQLGLKLIF
jgi:hypothetical protein